MDILSEIKEKREIQLEKEKKVYKRPSFRDALKQEGLKIIGEIKRASPSKGKIADNSFNLLNQVKQPFQFLRKRNISKGITNL